MAFSRARVVLVTILVAASVPDAARAGVRERAYVVSAGDSLWRIARAHRCEIAQLVRANRIAGHVIRAGQKLRIPAGCDVDRPRPAPARVATAVAAGQSVGRPQAGRLVAASRLPARPAAWFIRRPHRAFGTRATVDHVVRAIERVRRKHPKVHSLAIGDLSAQRGGKITMHGSHQSGRDVDLGFYFRHSPRGYPTEFAVASEENLDFAATWTLIRSLAETAGRPDGVERMFLNYATQEILWKLARKAGVAPAELDAWLQYPHGAGAEHGLIRHEPGHDEHIHVRFKCPPRDGACR